MKHKSVLYILCLLVSLQSCGNDKHIKQEIEQMMSNPINLCDKQMKRYICGHEVNDSNDFHHKYLQLLFVDSATCSPCVWNQMPLWQEFADSVRNQNTDVSFAFVFHTKSSNKDRFLETMCKDTLFHYPIFLDTAGVFIKNNPNIPSNRLLHSFLLNSDNRVILVGDPVQNIRIREMFDLFLQKDSKKNKM